MEKLPALWNRDTDLVLRDLVLRQAEVDWGKVASTIEWDTGDVTPEECQASRWVPEHMEGALEQAHSPQVEWWEFVKDNPVKGPWSSEEDEHLKRLVEVYGSKKWNLLAREFPGRSGKQCRERWHNHVDTRVKKGEWTAEEDQILCEAQRQLGNKWSEMSRILHGRSENAIKNRFNSLSAKGLTETRANELLSKVGLEAYTTGGSRRRYPPHGGGYGYDQHAHGTRVGSARPFHYEDGAHVVKRSGGDGAETGSAERGRNEGVCRPGGVPVARGNDEERGMVVRESAAMHALMAAVTEEREACVLGAGGDAFREVAVENGRCLDSTNNRNGRGDRNPTKIESRHARRREDENDSIRAGAECLLSSRDGSWKEGYHVRWRASKKRDRDERRHRASGPWEIAWNRVDMARNDVEPMSVLAEAPRGRRTKASPQCLSVLARAAGVVEFEDDEDGASGATCGGNEASNTHSDRFYATFNNTSNGKYSIMATSKYSPASHEAAMSGGGPSGRLSIQNPISMSSCHNANMGGATALRRIVDHGLTPPGSASPPPDASASGGTDVAVGGGGGVGSGSSGAGGAGASGAQAASDAENEKKSSWDSKSDNDDAGVWRAKTSRWCGSSKRFASAFAIDSNDTVSIEGTGAAYEGTWKRGSALELAGPASASPRSGWYVGPDGAYRQGLGAVPGPWRPYWRGSKVGGDVVAERAAEGANPEVTGTSNFKSPAPSRETAL